VLNLLTKLLKKNKVHAPIKNHEKLQNQSGNFYGLLNPYGVLNTSCAMSDEEKRRYSIWFDFKERAECAMIVAQFYPGGDYFEFGSEGVGTLRNFLTAFDLNGKSKVFPETMFYAFDIFGDMTGAESDLEYFRAWHDSELDRYKTALKSISDHNLFKGKVVLVKGFFRDTINQKFKTEYISKNRKIGFAFLDCNITNSYSEVFSFLRNALLPKAFVYMDEFFCNDDVPKLYAEFVKQEKKESLYIRNAGCFGALFQLTDKNQSAVQ
jgi:hypothetical protein